MNAGMMILVSTDAARAGPYTRSPNPVIHNQVMAMYEIIYADPSQTEFAHVQVTVSGMGIALVYADVAPFYVGGGAGFPTPTPANPMPTAVPRFSLAGIMMLML